VLRDEVGIDIQRGLDGLLGEPLGRLPLVQTLTILVHGEASQRAERRQRLGDAPELPADDGGIHGAHVRPSWCRKT
jgi:hypothetical protein